MQAVKRLLQAVRQTAFLRSAHHEKLVINKSGFKGSPLNRSGVADWLNVGQSVYTRPHILRIGIMRIVTYQEMVNFIDAQPDEREVDFGEHLGGDPCGCVMQQFGRDVLGFGQSVNCCNDSWYLANVTERFTKLAKLDATTFGKFRPTDTPFKCTYAEVKAHIRKVGQCHTANQ